MRSSYGIVAPMSRIRCGVFALFIGSFVIVGASCASNKSTASGDNTPTLQESYFHDVNVLTLEAASARRELASKLSAPRLGDPEWTDIVDNDLDSLGGIGDRWGGLNPPQEFVAEQSIGQAYFARLKVLADGARNTLAASDALGLQDEAVELNGANLPDELDGLVAQAGESAHP